MPDANDLPTTLDPAKRSLMLPPTVAEIDFMIQNYETIKTTYEVAKAELDRARDHMILMVEKFGHRPPHAEQSKRLHGTRNTATATTGTSVVVNESAVYDLQLYLVDLPAIFSRLFNRQTKHTLVEGAHDVLKEIELPRRKHEKILSLFGRCIEIKTKAPSLKIEIVKAEKPTAKPRSNKGVA